MLIFSQKQFLLGFAHLVSVLAFGAAKSRQLHSEKPCHYYTGGSRIGIFSFPLLTQEISEKLSCKFMMAQFSKCSEQLLV